MNKDDKPPDARATLKSSGNSLFVEPQSHAALARETVAKLEAYAKGTPAALERFYKVRERIRREEQGAATIGLSTSVEAGNPWAGSPSLPIASNPQVLTAAAIGYDASRDPRRRF